jgi:hypothetical protein
MNFRAVNFCPSFRRKPESSVFPQVKKALDPGFRRDDGLKSTDD